MKRINEIFYSIQGEGNWNGTPAVFVRFSGCNLKCPFCDTEHQEQTLMSDEQIIEEVLKYPAKHVVLTGGEPGLQITEELVDKLKKHEIFVQVETNGTIPLPKNINWVTCSPKEGHPIKLDERNIAELKVVYTGQDLSQYNEISAIYRYLQPCSGKNTEEVIEYVKNNPQWTLSVQIHKLLNIR